MKLYRLTGNSQLTASTITTTKKSELLNATWDNMVTTHEWCSPCPRMNQPDQWKCQRTPTMKPQMQKAKNFNMTMELSRPPLTEWGLRDPSYERPHLCLTSPAHHEPHMAFLFSATLGQICPPLTEWWLHTCVRSINHHGHPKHCLQEH
jgi:hypothetical protein